MNNAIGIYYEMPDGVIAYVSGWSGTEKTVTYYCDAENSGGTIPEEEWHTWKPREDLKDFPNARDPRLPYEFDLNWDIKYVSQLKDFLTRGDDVRAVKIAMNEHGITIPGMDMSIPERRVTSPVVLTGCVVKVRKDENLFYGDQVRLDKYLIIPLEDAPQTLINLLTGPLGK